jgi:type VI secretion system secreted protein Hcp
MRIGSINGLIGKVILMVLGFSFILASAASANLFLKFDGIEGESTNDKHPKWSNISDVSWGVSDSQASGGGGSGVGKVVFDDLSWSQVIDKSVTALFDDIASGKHIKDATIDFTTSGSEPYTYFQMLFEDVFLTKLKVAGTSSSIATVAGDFAYDKITMTYTYKDETGKLVSTEPVSYDLSEGKGSVGALSYLFGLGISGPTTIPPVPVPASLLLLGSGLVGLIGWRRIFKL